ncbi:MAG: DUF839 domain-containing protein [Planctomycetota bacterium]|nr:DUF839 domain-containing protein [Planctomycetota bacterium]
MSNVSIRPLVGALAVVLAAGSASAQIQGPSSSATPYVIPVASGVVTKSILSVGDTIGGYKMVGIPDGMGGYSNGDGTFTLLVNHELGSTVGAVRAHGSKGAFVSKWIIDANTLSVSAGEDLIKKTFLGGLPTYTEQTTAIARLCSADLPPVSAFYNSVSGKGTSERIFMNGEETGAEGRAFASIVTGPDAGNAYVLPYLGKFSWENSLASIVEQDTTLVIGTDDSTPGQVYAYVGTKTNSGLDIDKAGLTNGKLYGIAVAGAPVEDRVNGVGGTKRFSLVEIVNAKSITGAALDTASIAAGVTNFLRPEDGAWDPMRPADFYFVTTDRIDQTVLGQGSNIARSRLWRLRFDDISNPLAGGEIRAILNGTEGQQMFDNMCIDTRGFALIQEDPGNNAYGAKIWQVDLITGQSKIIAKHDTARFGDIGVTATAPYTQDEESSGIFDAKDILGDGWFLLCDQAHYSSGIPADLVEGGQLLALYNPQSATPTDAGDFNGDGMVDFSDFDRYVLAFDGGHMTADTNGDGFLDFTDFDAFVNVFEN